MNRQQAVLFSFSFIVIHSLGELPHFEHIPVQPHNFTFLVVGDWGRKGEYRQPEVAYQMGVVAKRFQAEFVVSTGDNFYEYGLYGESDPAFEESFTNIYNQEGLNKRWYIGYVDIFFVDTTPMADDYFGVGGYGRWTNRMPRTEYNSGLINDLDLAMGNSNAKWKIVVGHHAIVSAGAHGATEDVVRLLEPTLLKHNVDFYFNGHDHCLQMARKPYFDRRPNKIRFVTSGGGSAAAWDKPNPTILPGQDESEFFYYGGEGFVMAEIKKHSEYVHLFELSFYDSIGNRLYKWNTIK